MGLHPEPFYALCLDAAQQLLHPDAYISSITGGNP
jgi:hypothetical protein